MSDIPHLPEDDDTQEWPALVDEPDEAPSHEAVQLPEEDENGTQADSDT
jgi:hypothetical protein